MTILAARRYRDGRIIRDHLTPGLPPVGEGEFDWIGLADPTDAELEWIGQAYNLHPLALEDAHTPDHAPKVETFGTMLSVIARTATLGPGETITFGQTTIFLGHDFVVTIRLGSTRAHTEMRAQLEANSERLAEGPDVVLYAVLDFIVSGYEPLIDELEGVVGEMEDSAVDEFPDQANIRRIFRLRRLLRKVEGTCGRLEEVSAKLAQTEQVCIDDRARPFFRDVHDSAKRSVWRARGLNQTLGSILEVAGLLEQSRQGAITRQLAAWAAILAVPTAIAGIYGMNFDFMPELRWRYAYFVVLGVVATSCTVLYSRFRRMGWL
ncbi:magnesium transporter [Altererythrobacter xixiisoli]|uniref:Magnesium transporter n=1 Tax=Croceibacterium xixiisoli TaxID=1476466 RepID=A0A6I4TZ05_9SPHN|nr:magnesium and cobalt transport protein CorA [Croceibacterium xixiisoli]MXP00350.1 magnesium transporter [Croceibacterium xixiisoli]